MQMMGDCRWPHWRCSRIWYKHVKILYKQKPYVSIVILIVVVMFFAIFQLRISNKRVLLFLFVNSAVTTDYCRKGLCRDGKTHVGCRNRGTWGSTTNCGKNPTMYVLTKADKEFILDLHNQNRQDIACGSIPNYKPAANMSEVHWNDELAKVACFNAKSCIFAHDQCRNTDDHPYSGQNLAICGHSRDYRQFREAYQDLHTQWFMEHKDCNMKTIRKFQSNGGEPQIGHFTQLVSDNMDEVGCCITKFEKKGMKCLYIVCNYSYTNMVGRPIYVEGKPKCKKYSKKYKSLCAA